MKYHDSGTAVVVTHNSAECIDRCLRALQAQAGWEIVLVDNASKDETLAYAQKFSGSVRILAEDHNLGFAGAVNRAFNSIASSVVVIVNPDAVPHPGALERLATAVANPSIGAAGGLLISDDGTPQRGFVMRRFPTLGSMLCETLLLNRIWPGNPWNRRYRYGDIDYGRPQSVNQPAGAALAFRREVWEQLGGFDEQFYPVWFEDVDFCRRIRQHGWDIVYEPNAVFTHQGGHSVRRLSFSEQQLFWYRNLLRYFRKYHSGAEVLTLRIAIIIGMAIRSAAVLAGVGPSCVSREEALRAFRLVFHQCVLNTGECSATSQRSSKNFTS